MSSSKSLHFYARHVQRPKGLSAIGSAAYFIVTPLFDVISNERDYESGKDRGHHNDCRMKNAIRDHNTRSPPHSSKWGYEKPYTKRHIITRSTQRMNKVIFSALKNCKGGKTDMIIIFNEIYEF